LDTQRRYVQEMSSRTLLGYERFFTLAFSASIGRFGTEVARRRPKTLIGMSFPKSSRRQPRYLDIIKKSGIVMIKT
jgi:hypothetical protein